MTQSLSDFSDALAITTANAGTGIVRVEGRRRMPASGIIWRDNGLIITAHHVVQQDNGLAIGLPDGRTVAAKLIGRDPSTDLAIIQAEASGLTPLTHAPGKEISIGQLALAMGRPGQKIQATLGIISALEESWRTGAGGLIDQYIQTDVLMYPGFSGGPLVDAHGRLIGLNSSALAHGVSLTIPTSTLTRVTESLLAHGRVRRGYLGVNTQRVHLPEAIRQQLGQKSGLLIVSVEAGSPAEQGGLTLGDTIVSLAGQAVHRHDDLLAALGGDRVDTAVPLQILRGGQLLELHITIGERA